MAEEKLQERGLATTLGIVFTSSDKDCITGTMPITSAVLQPFGFLHGGATISFLESLASYGAQLSANLETERPFGTVVEIRHRKSGVSGLVHGTAKLAGSEPSHTAGIKQYWDVSAVDDAGDVISDGRITVKIVPVAYLEKKKREREEARARG